MRVLFDQGTPAPLHHLLPGHAVSTAYELGRITLKNGEFLAAAEGQAFDVFVTTDTNLKQQQNLVSRRIAILVLSTTSWPRIKVAAEVILMAIDAVVPGQYFEVAIP